MEVVGDAGNEGIGKAVILSFTDSTLAFPFVGSIDFPVKQLFIRSFYDPLINDVLKCFHDTSERPHHVIVTGNPGIGKSAFGVYLLVRALQQGRPVVYQSGPASGACYLFEHGRVTRFSTVDAVALRIESDPQLLYIADSYTPLYGMNKCTTILITSPLLVRYKEYEKQTQASTMIFPVFMDAEVALMHEHCYPTIREDLVRERLALWGGIPRKLFSTKATVEQDRAIVTGIATRANPKDVFIESRMPVLELAASVSHKIFHVHNLGVVKGLSPSDPDFYNFFARSLSTERVEEIARQAWVTSQRKKLADLVSNTEGMQAFASARGIFHETIAGDILKQGGEFSSRLLTFASLGQATGATRPAESSIILRPKDHVLFNNMEELRQLYAANPDRFFSPVSRSFCAVDLILPKGLMVQFTVSDDHGLILESNTPNPKSNATLNNNSTTASSAAITPAAAVAATAALPASARGGVDVVAKALGLGENAEIPIYFAVPPDKYRSYPAQSMKRNGVTVKVGEIAKDAIARRVRQHVLLLPYPSPIGLATLKQQTRSFSTSTRPLSISRAWGLTSALRFVRK